MKKISKLIAIACLCVMALLPSMLSAYAATSVTGLTDTNIGVEYNVFEGTLTYNSSRKGNASGSWTASGTTISGDITPGYTYRSTIGFKRYYPDASARTELKLTNNSGEKAVLSFSYTNPSSGSISFSSNVVHDGSSASATLESDASIVVTITTASNPDNELNSTQHTKYKASATLSNVQLVSANRGLKIELATATNGSYSAAADGSAISVGATHEKPISTVYSFTAVPAANYQLEGWYFNGVKYSSTERIISDVTFGEDTKVEARFVIDPLLASAISGEGLDGEIEDFIQVDTVYYHNPAGSWHTTAGDIKTNNSYGPPYVFADPGWAMNSNGTGVVSSISGKMESDVQTEAGRCNAQAYVYSNIIRIKCLQNCKISFDAAMSVSHMTQEADFPTVGVYLYMWQTTYGTASPGDVAANGTAIINGVQASSGQHSTGYISLNEGDYLYLYANGFPVSSDMKYIVTAGTYDTINYSYSSTISNRTVSSANEMNTIEVGNYDNTGALLQSGSVRVDGIDNPLSSSNYTDTAQRDTEYTLAPGTAPAGYTFIGWQINDREPVYTSTECVYALDGDSVVKALYVPAMTITAGGANGYLDATYTFGNNTYTKENNPYYVARNADSTAFYKSLDAAFAGTDKIVLLASCTINGDMTIPAGKTLIIPYAHADDGISGENPDQTLAASGMYNYCTLRYNGNLTVDGTLLVNGLQTAAGAMGGMPVGGIGCLILGDSSVVTLNGQLYAFGHVRGGQINASSTATVHETMEAIDVRSVLVMNEIINAKGTYKVLPFTHMAVESIESSVTYNKGAKLKGHYSAYLQGTAIGSYGAANIIGADGAQCWLKIAEGSLTKYYDLSKNQSVYRIDQNSTVSTDGIECKFDYAYGSQSTSITLKSVEYFFPLNQNIAFEIAGTMNFNSDHKFLPGSRLVVTETGTCNINSGANIAMYRSNDYDNRAPGAGSDFMGYSQYGYPVYGAFYPLGGYAPAYGLDVI